MVSAFGFGLGSKIEIVSKDRVMPGRAAVVLRMV
jgi:hypothetical protein